MRRNPLVYLGLIWSLSGTVAAAEWPGWRGPDGSGISPGKNLPTRWSGTENVRWKIPLEGAGVSVPVVWGDRIFLTTSDGRTSDQLHIWCYQRSDGRTLWHARFFGSAQPEGQFAPGGMAVPTVATDGQHVAALFGTGDLVCVDFDGKPVWIRSLAEEYGPFRNRWGMGASPILLGGLVFIQVDHWGQSYLLAVDVKSGTTRWKTNRDASVNWSSPAVAKVKGRTQLIATGTYQVKGYDAEDGRELWTVNGMQMQCIPTPVVQGDIAYAVSGRRGYTLAIRLDGSQGDLTSSHVVWKKTRGAPFVPSALCYGGQYYLVDDTGMLTCLDAATGETLYQERLGGKFHASPVAGDGKVYFASMEGIVTVVEAGPKYKLIAKNNIGETIVASPAIAHGEIFLRGEKQLFCIQSTKP